MVGRAPALLVCAPLIGALLACGPQAPGSDDDSSESSSSEATASTVASTTLASTTVASSETAGELTTGATTSAGATEEATGETSDSGAPPWPGLPEPCALAPSAILDTPLNTDSVLGTRLYTLDPGGPGAPARVMTVQRETVGDGHGNYKARAFELAATWEPGAVVSVAPVLPLTHSGHYISRLAPRLDDPARLAYVWTGDPDGTNDYDTFVTFLDLDAWAIDGELELVPSSNPSFVDILRTPAHPRFVTAYTTDSYGATPVDRASGFSLGVLDGDGAPLVEPAVLTEQTAAPGSGVRLLWSGDRIAAAIGHNACDAGPLCAPHSVVVARPSAPDETGAAADGFESAHVFAGLEGSGHVSRPAAFAEFGLTWLAWYESDDHVASDEHRTMRAVVLDDDGAPLPWPPGADAAAPVDFVVDVAMSSWPTMLVSELGITVVYRVVESDGDRAQRTFVVRHHDFTMQPLGEPIILELKPESASYPGLAALAEPRALLLAWDGVSDTADIVLRMARLECA